MKKHNKQIQLPMNNVGKMTFSCLIKKKEKTLNSNTNTICTPHPKIHLCPPPHSPKEIRPAYKSPKEIRPAYMIHKKLNKSYGKKECF